MAIHSSISELNPRLEDWNCYTEWLKHYFIANGIKADACDQRRAILLSICGPTTYQLIHNLFAPAKPTNKTYKDIITLVKDHHHPTPSSIVARKNFHSRVRKADESINDFIADLRKLSEHCDFGATLNQILFSLWVQWQQTTMQTVSRGWLHIWQSVQTCDSSWSSTKWH